MLRTCNLYLLASLTNDMSMTRAKHVQARKKRTSLTIDDEMNTNLGILAEQKGLPKKYYLKQLLQKMVEEVTA